MTEDKSTRFETPIKIAVFALVMLGLYFTSQYSYLLFHTASELFSIVVAFGIFLIGWSARRSLNSGYLLFVGIAFLFIAGLDTIHTLAYKGMGVFTGYDANLPTQLWIASRYLLSLSLLAALLFLRRKVNSGWVIAGFTLVTSLLVWSIFAGYFPACYVEGVGLTSFKVVSEYIISVLLLASIALLVKNRQEFDPEVLRYLVIGIGMGILSEIAFTDYVSVFGFANLLGHLFKIMETYFLFLAIIDTGFHKPFSLLLLNQKRNEDALRFAHDQLEQRIEERTRELAVANADLRAEVAERKRVEAALCLSEARFRTIFQESPIGVEVVDLDGKILASNAALQQMLGYSEAELTNQFFLDITDPADRPLSEVLFNDLISGTRDSYQYEKRYRNRDGKPIWTKLTVSLVRDEHSQPEFAIGMIENLTERERIETELREVQRRLMDSKEAERLSLARELHDGPIQDLLAAAIHLQQLRMDRTEEEGEEAAFIQDLVTQVSQTLRAICGELRPQALAPFGLEKAIRSHAERLGGEHADIKMHLELMPDGKELPEGVRMALYRIYQQSLNNVIRHAKATQVCVRFAFDSQKISLEIQDNGRGFKVPDSWLQLVREGHLGLAGISERAEAVGGKACVVSQPGEGTRIQVTVPRDQQRETALTASRVRV